MNLRAYFRAPSFEWCFDEVCFCYVFLFSSQSPWTGWFLRFCFRLRPSEFCSSYGDEHILRQPVAIPAQTAPLNPQQACPRLSQRKRLGLTSESWITVLFHSANRPSLFGVCSYDQRARGSHHKGKPFLILIMLQELNLIFDCSTFFLSGCSLSH